MAYNCLFELVSLGLGHVTKMALHTLQHENILTVKEVMRCFSVPTVLVSAAGVFVRALPALRVPTHAVSVA